MSKPLPLPDRRAPRHVSSEHSANLSRQLLEAQERERRRIARELHDELGQILTAAKMTLVSATRTPEHDCPATEQVREGINLVAQAIDRVRTIALELRPSVLDDLGLVPALRWYLRQQAQRAGFRVTLNAPTQTARVAPDVETACYRIVQEAVTNVIRHSGAVHVTLNIGFSDRALTVRVTDDGSGFDFPTAQARAHAGGSLGLLGMAERAALVGGSLSIDATPGGGTVVSIVVPLGDAAK